MSLTYEKTPAEILSFSLDWSAWLDTDTIDTSLWAVNSSDITVSGSSSTSTTTTVTLSAGLVDATYTVTNTITTVTAPSQTVERSFRVRVREFRFVESAEVPSGS